LTLALSHEAHDGSRWSQRFLRSRQRLQALTLRNDDADDADALLAAAGVAGLAGFCDVAESDGEGSSPS
jgi:hypothetical protein